MASAASPHRPPPRPAPVLRRLGSALYWTAAVVLGAFGAYFTLANYPWLGTALVLLLVLLAGLSEWKRRARQNARDEARRRDQARMR